MDALGIKESARVSFAMYNTKQEVDHFIKSIEKGSESIISEVIFDDLIEVGHSESILIDDIGTLNPGTKILIVPIISEETVYRMEDSYTCPDNFGFAIVI